MKYLLYIRKGFIKKFPLNKPIITLGRDKNSDLVLNEPFISKNHLRIELEKDQIKIIDLDSKNGFFIEGLKRSEYEIGINHSFQIGNIEFILKIGDPEEFEISEESKILLERTFSKISTESEETETGLNLFDRALVTTLQIGLKSNDFGTILNEARLAIEMSLKDGLILVLSKYNKSINIISELNLGDVKKFDPEELISMEESSDKDYFNKKTGNFYANSIGIKLNGNPGALVYIKNSKISEHGKTIKFLKDLGKELSILYKLFKRDKNYKQDSLSKIIITRNKNFIRLFEKVKKMADSDINILISGETGVGKEMMSRFIHDNSDAKKDKYIGINCSAIPDTLLEVELFGNEKGAFTDAKYEKKGKLELASGGTLVLDEIGDMPLNLQTKLLRVLQEQEFYRIGGSRAIKVNLRVISITNQNLKEMIKENRFREDLYYRLAHFKFTIPPLRERSEDIELLLNHFVEKFANIRGIKIKGVSKNVIKILKKYPWPGNIRELENEVKNLINQADDGEIIAIHMVDDDIKAENLTSNIIYDKKDFPANERERIKMILEKNRWNKSETAKELNITRMTLYKRMRLYGL